MLIADYLHRIKNRLKKKNGGSRKKSGGSADKRRRKKALRYLESKDARIYKKIDGIHLIQYPAPHRQNNRSWCPHLP